MYYMTWTLILKLARDKPNQNHVEFSPKRQKKGEKPP